MIYGMQKTTVYIPEDVKRALGQVAAARGVSEAELIREALHTLTSKAPPPRPPPAFVQERETPACRTVILPFALPVSYVQMK